MKTPWMVVVLGVTGTLLAGCQSDVVVAGNLMVASVPCVLMVLTMNLKRIR